MTASLRIRPTQELIAEVSTRVLRESALLCARLLPDPPRSHDGWEPVGARLSFSGPWQGHLEAWIPKGIVALMAANLLGVDDRPGEAEEPGLDALRELTSILCGALMNALAPGEPDVRLGTPSGCRHPKVRAGGMKIRELWLEVEGEPMLLRLHLRPHAAPAA